MNILIHLEIKVSRKMDSDVLYIKMIQPMNLIIRPRSMEYLVSAEYLKILLSIFGKY